jgi:hypothetical protein
MNTPAAWFVLIICVVVYLALWAVAVAALWTATR